MRFEVDTDPARLPVGSSFDNVGQAYANSDPRTVPDFDAAGVYTGDASVQGASAPERTTVSAIRVRKSEPSPENELRRGVHDHSTVYALQVTNNSGFLDDDVVLVDHLPAQMEFLGCGTADNSSPGTVEYPTAPRLDASTPDVPGCVTPVSVQTVTNPTGLPAGVYTRVEWSLGDLTAGQVVDVRYRAGIPQRANVATFPGGAPTPASLQQGANLDNNTGASTREVGEQALTNHASVSADYTGPVAPGTPTRVTDDHQWTVTAEDLAVQKSVTPGVFAQGGVATYTLQLQTGEYADATDIVLTDVIPNGLCPLDDVANHATGDPAECDPSAGFAPSVPFESVTENPDGTFTVVFDPIDLAASGEATITYQARMLEDYRDAAVPTVAGDAYTNTVSLTAQTTTLASVDAPGGVSTVTVEDQSEATIQSDTLELDKLIQPNTTSPLTCATTPGGYADAASLPAAQTTFSEGSRVCFLLRVDFPGGSETKNAVLTDFLPDYLDAPSVAPVTGNQVTTVFDPTDLTFTLGDQVGSDRFVPRGQTFLYRISGIVNDSAFGAPDVTGNLAKLQWTNTAGTVSFLRDREDFTIAAPPPVSVDKTENDADNVIRAGAVVDFAIAVQNNGTEDVVGPDVWDRLPAGVRCADVSAITSGGACTNPGDAGHPSFALNGTLSAIRWNHPDSVRIAPAATGTVTYRVTYPATVAPGTRYRNEVDVASYATESNLETLAQHYPQQNVDTTVPDADEDVPQAHDQVDLNTPAPTITKTNETGVDDVEQGTNPATINYAAVGETVTYTVTGTLPALTTVYAGQLFDTTPSGIRVDSVAFTYRAAPGDAFGPLPAGFTGTTPAAGPRVALPATLDVGAEADAVRMVITATVLDQPGNVHGVLRQNTARLSSRSGAAGATVTQSASSTITVVEPVPAPLKTVDDDTPVANQTLTYTITAQNTGAQAGRRPTLFEAVLVDCVPAELSVVGGSLATSSGTAVVDPSSTACAAGQTPIVWQVGDLAGAAPWPSLTYRAVVNPAAAGGATYTNTAVLRGTSMDGADPDERTTYTGDVDETVTVPGTELIKTVTPARAPVGAEVTYDVEVELPADVNFYDATIVDDLPSGIDMASVDLTASTCTFVGAPAGPCGVVATDAGRLTPQGELHGWFLGDVTSSPRARLLTLTYTAVVADVASNVAGATVVNTAELAWNQVDSPGTPEVDDTFASSTDPDTATVTVSEPSLTIEKTVSDTTPLPGETFTYTVRVTNATGANVSAAHDVDVLDTVPAGVVVIGAPTSGGTVATGPPATVRWTDLGPIAPAGSVVLSYTARLATPAPTAAQVNTAEVTEYTSIDDGGRTYDGPSDTASVTAGLPSVEVVKTTPDPVSFVGESSRWQIVVSNTGPATAHDVDVVDVLPEHWTYDADSARVSVAGDPAAPVEPSVAGSPQTLTWDDLGDLAPNESLTIVLTATPGAGVVPDHVGSTVAHVNAATATAKDLETGGSVVTTDSDDAATRIDAADLTLDKEAVGTPVAGETTSWTITVGNDGPDTATGPFEVVDVLPTQVTGAVAAGVGWSCSTAGGEITCVRADPADTLAAGATFAPITVTATVPDGLPAGSDLVNAATVTATTHEVDDTDNSDEVTTEVTTSSDLGIDKALTGALVPGAAATYTIDVRNDGPSQARGPIVVTDTLPAALTYVSHQSGDWELSRSGQTLTFTWQGGTPVPVGAMQQIAVEVMVASDVTSTVTNSASVTEPTDPTSGPESPDSDSVPASPAPSADLVLTKTSPGAFDAGTQGEYVFEVLNEGPSDAAGPITVSDTLPASLTYVAVASNDGWTCSAAGQVMTCSRSAGLAVGDSTSFTVTVDIDEALTGAVRNTATVDSPTPDPHAPNDTDDDDTSIDVKADLGIDKVLQTDPVVAGEEVVYTLDVTNHGPATSPGTVTVTDTLPAGLTYVSASGGGWVCTAAAQVVTCDRGASLASGASAATITVTADVAAGLGTTTLQNVASVDGPATDTDPDNDTDAATTSVTEDTEIALVKTTTGADPVRAGEEATFEIVVSNSGSSDARTVTVTDELPAEMTLVSASGTGWSCEAGVCTTDLIEAGTSAPPITVVGRVASGTPAGTTLTNEATVTTATPGDTAAGNTDDADVDVVAGADLALDKSHATGAGTAGLPTTFSLTVTNNGPSDAVGPITVVDSLPAPLSYVSANAPWSCAAAGQQVTCTFPQDLVAGATAPVLELQVMVADDAPTGAVTNSALVSSGTPDPVPANDVDRSELDISQLADVSVVKSHQSPVRVGDTLEFELLVSNEGPSPARDVVVTDELPSGLEFVSAAGTDWTCGQMTGAVTCSLAGNLPHGATAPPITVVTNVTPTAYPAVVNAAVVTTSTTEVDRDDNVDDDPVTVPPLVDLAVKKSHRGKLAVGEPGTYEIVVTNHGPTSAPGPVTITDHLPRGLEFVSATQGREECELTGREVTCVLTGGLDVDESAQVELVVEVLASAYPRVVNVASATSPAEQVGGPGNDTDTDAARVKPDVDLVVDKEAVDVAQDRVVYEVAVTNEGRNATVSAVWVRDQLPKGLALRSASGNGWSCTTTYDLAQCAHARSISPGDSAVIRVVTKVLPSAGDVVTNVARVRGGGDRTTSADAAKVTPADDDRPDGGNGAGGDGDGEGPGSYLPDTGGPGFWLLLVGLLLVGSGGGMLVRCRRGPSSVTGSAGVGRARGGAAPPRGGN